MSRFGNRSAKLARESFHLGLLIVGILAARSTLADHYYVPSGSMENTLFAGDRVLVDKRAYGYRIPFTNVDVIRADRVRRGDVVVFDSPKDGVRLIKRIVAIGGDRVLIENGRISINGEWLAAGEKDNVENFDGKIVELNLRDGGGPPLDITVGADQVLAIGDHRGRSADSRYFGTVPEREIYGRAVAVYYRRGDGFGWRSL